MTSPPPESSQLPSLTPSFFAPFTRRMPAASSGLNRPESDASYARRRTAARCRLIVAGARRPSSRCIRNRITTVLLKERRGSEQYHATKSSMLRPYSRFEPDEAKLPTTAALACSRSGRPSFVFGRTSFPLFLGFMATASRTVATSLRGKCRDALNERKARLYPSGPWPAGSPNRNLARAVRW